MLPRVRRLARSLIRERDLPPSVTVDDLVGPGMQGVVEAAGRYVESRGTFRAFAERRARGAMLDYLRSLDPLSRNARARVNAGLEPFRPKQPPKPLLLKKRHAAVFRRRATEPCGACGHPYDEHGVPGISGCTRQSRRVWRSGKSGWCQCDGFVPQPTKKEAA